ncbi:MAG TPA: VWA domain-containing protein [Vicinamibacterales bacterium]|nr:VWA domain-containing protein [Vicinamibacterales bacterium]
MRATAASAVLVACGLAGLAAQSAQAPVFRSGVELLEVEVSVVDGSGKPVDNLRAPDFAVSVDGQLRRVVSSEYISDVSAESQLAGVTVDPYVSNNTDRRPGRLIVLVIDQNNMTMARLRGALESVRVFIDSLAPNDRVALMSIPSPGPRVDFTTNHKQVKAALNGVMSNGEIDRTRFNISNYEALALDEKSDAMTIQRMLARLCGDASPGALATCGSDVEQDAMQLAQRIRLQATESVSALGVLLKNLKEVEGSKSLILLSQGLNIEGTHSEAGSLAQLAAEARTSVNVLLFDTSPTDASERMVSATQGADRDLREAGLESLASRSRGALFRINTNPTYTFERITRELAGHYLLGVESPVADRDGKRHDIKVKVQRQGTQVRARQQFQYVSRAPNTWSRDDLMGRVLRSPSSATEIPMRVTTYSYQDMPAGSGKARIIVAAEIDPTTNGAVDVAIGHALYDEEGRLVDVGQERKIYSPNSDRPLRYETALSVNPGKYRFRIAAIDLSGNSGSVEREVQAWQTGGQQLALGDLMLAGIRDTRGGAIRPPVLLKVDDGQLAAFTEVYTNKPGSLDDAKVSFEIAEDADGPMLKSDVAQYRLRDDGTSAQAGAILPVGALPPGRYIVRAVVSSGGRTVGKLVRPFLLLPPNTAAPKGGGTAAGATAAGATPADAANAGNRPSDASSPVTIAPGADAGLVGANAASFRKEDVLQPDILRAVFDALDKSHPSARAALSKARAGQLEGTALMALDAGDQAAGAMLRGLEFLSKGQLDPAATQFGVALRNAPDSPLAGFYLGACYAAAGKDREAITNWDRARAANVPVPAIGAIIGEAWIRLGQPGQAIAPLADALARQPQNDALRKDLAIAQSRTGQHPEAYATIAPYLARNENDTDALIVALQAIYQAHAEGKSIGTADEDKAKAVEYAHAYAAAKGPNQALVDKWLQFLGTGR